MFKLLKTPVIHFIIFTIIIVVISYIGYSFYNNILQREKKEAYSNLSTLARVKINQIVNWRNEKISEAEFIYSNRYFNVLFFNYLLNTSDRRSLGEIEEWIKPIMNKSDYTDAILIRNSSRYFSLIHSEKILFTDYENDLLKACVNGKNIILSDIHWDNRNDFSMEILIPLIEKRTQNVFGILLLKINPAKNLFPLILEKPELSETAESFIVRRDGDSVLFLNNLKDKKNSALTFKLPLSQKDLPTVMAISGLKGIYEGIDYTGNKVLADLNKIPDSPWFIISKINLDEVYAPIREQTLFIITGGLTLITIFGLVIYSAWKNQKIRYLNRQLEVEKEKQAAEEQVRKLSSAVEQSPATIVITDTTGHIEYANPKFTALTGYTLEEAQGENPRILKSGMTPDSVFKELWDTLKNGNQWQGEFINKKKNGELFWEYASIAPIKNESGIITHYVAVKEDITALKKAEEELNRSKEQLSNIIETAMDGVVTLDENQNIVLFNSASEKMFKISTSEVIGKPISRFIPQRFHDTHQQNIHHFGEKNTEPRLMGKNGVIVGLDSTGEEFYMEASISQFVISGRKYYTIIHRDITERLRVEETIKKSEEKFVKMFKNSPVAMALVDFEEFLILDTNHSFERLYGYKHNEVIGKTSNDIPIYEDINQREEIIARIKSGKPVSNIEIKVKRKDGSKRIVLITNEFIDIEGKKCLLSISQDITERKLAEIALLESEQRFRHLADAMPQLVWTANPDGFIDYYNNRVVEFDGITQTEEGTWQWAPVLYPDDILPTIEAWNTAVNTGNIYEITHRVKKKDGSFKWYLSRGIPIKNKSAEIIKWYGTSTDISNQKQAEQNLEAALIELNRSNRDLEQFAYTASHDLQEPIRMIKSYAQLLEMKNKDTESAAREYLNYISEGASRMQQLVNDLLKYSRVTTTKQEFEEVDFNSILKDVLDDLKFRIEEEDAIIHIEELPVIKGDRTQLRQLFQNFLQNAIKFRSEMRLEIKVSCERRNNNWLFSISDNGIGIDKQFFERIFVVFQRLHDRDKYPGTGIGLALCKKIVERHGGQVCVESEPGKGTIFYFTLPA